MDGGHSLFTTVGSLRYGVISNLVVSVHVSAESDARIESVRKSRARLKVQSVAGLHREPAWLQSDADNGTAAVDNEIVGMLKAELAAKALDLAYKDAEIAALKAKL